MINAPTKSSPGKSADPETLEIKTARKHNSLCRGCYFCLDQKEVNLIGQERDTQSDIELNDTRVACQYISHVDSQLSSYQREDTYLDPAVSVEIMLNVILDNVPGIDAGRPGVQALKTRKSLCEGYADLMMIMCRYCTTNEKEINCQFIKIDTLTL